MLAASSLTVTACQAGQQTTRRAGQQAVRQAARIGEPGLTKLVISPGQGSVDDRPDLGVAVSASGGHLTAVTVRDLRGDEVAGYVRSGGASWHSAWALAAPQTYDVTATAVGPRGRIATQHATFRTAASAQTFTASVDMAPGETVGVGMPIMVTFSRPVRDKAEVERSFEIRSSKPVVGAWYWLDDKTVWFRPRAHWPAYDRVRLLAHLAGVRAANGVYGAADLSRRFTIGRSLVTIASASSHRMRVWVNGRLRFDWPISTGQPGDDTPDGEYLTIDKGNPVDMDSCSYGVCPGDPGYYNLLVYDSVRFTWSGDYIHSAPWSVGEQGVTNVSHGCVNLAPDHAAWYYAHADRGEPVTIVGSPVRGTWGDGWTIWFLPWQQLLKGSALKQAVVAGPAGSYFARSGALNVPPSGAAPAARSAGVSTAPAAGSAG